MSNEAEIESKKERINTIRAKLAKAGLKSTEEAAEAISEVAEQTSSKYLVPAWEGLKFVDDNQKEDGADQYPEVTEAVVAIMATVCSAYDVDPNDVSRYESRIAMGKIGIILNRWREEERKAAENGKK